jgi:hypothetical protein
MDTGVCTEVEGRNTGVDSLCGGYSFALLEIQDMILNSSTIPR